MIIHRFYDTIVALASNPFVAFLFGVLIAMVLVVARHDRRHHR